MKVIKYCNKKCLSLLKRIKIQISKSLKEQRFDLSVSRNRKYNLDNLYIGYLGIIKKISDNKFRFEQLREKSIVFAYKNLTETLEYDGTEIIKRDSFKNYFNNKMYYSYFTDFININNGEVVFAPLILLSHYLPFENRVDNEISEFELIDLMNYLNHFLSNINFNSEFNEPYKDIKELPDISYIDKIEYKRIKPKKMQEDLTYEKVLAKHNIKGIINI